MPTRANEVGERELTTGWQFATQIEDDDEGDETNERGTKAGFEMGAGLGEEDYANMQSLREAQNRSALLIQNRGEMFPSMLDPAFDEDYDESPGPIAKEVDINSARSVEMNMAQMSSNALQLANRTHKNKMQVARFTEGASMAVFKREPLATGSDYYS